MTTIDEALTGRTGAVRLSYRYLLADRNNAVRADITAAVAGKNGQITLDNDRLAARTASLTIHPAEVPETIDPINDYIRIQAILTRDGAEDLFELGLYQLNFPTKLFAPAQETWTVRCVDTSVFLLERTLGEPFTISQGQDMLGAVAALLAAANIRNTVPDTGGAAPFDITWDGNTTLGRVANDVLRGQNYWPLFARADGTLVARSRENQALAAPAVEYAVADGWIIPPWTEQWTPRQHANEHTVSREGPGGAPIWATVLNQDGAAINSTTVTGATKRVSEAIDTVPDVATAISVATQDAREASTQARTAKLRTPIDPRREPHEVYRVSVPDADVQGEIWAVRSWRMPLTAGGRMEYVLGKPIDLTAIAVSSSADVA